MKMRKRRPPSRWKIPPKVARYSGEAKRYRTLEPKPVAPSKGTILGLLGGVLLTGGLLTGLWLPSHILVTDLQARGVTTLATVTAVTKHPRSVKVRFIGPDGPMKTDLMDVAGRLPETHVKGSISVTYDPRTPSRVLERSWVTTPVFLNLPVLGSAAMFVLTAAGTGAAILRRRHILRDYGPPHPSLAPTPPNPDEPHIPLTKS